MNKKTMLRLSIATALLVLLLPSILIGASRARGMGPPPSQCPNLYPAKDFAAAQVYLPNGTSINLIARPNATFTTTLDGGYTLFLELEVQSNYTQPPGSVYVRNTAYNFDSYSCYPSFAGQAFTYTVHVQGSLFRQAGVQSNVVWEALSNYTENPATDGYTRPVQYNVHWVTSTSASTATVTTTLPVQTFTATQTTTEATTVTSSTTVTTTPEAVTVTAIQTASNLSRTSTVTPPLSTTTQTATKTVTLLVSRSTGVSLSASSSPSITNGSSKSGGLNPSLAGSNVMVVSIAAALIVGALLAFAFAQRGRRRALE